MPGYEFHKRPATVLALQWFGHRSDNPPLPAWFAELVAAGRIERLYDGWAVKVANGVRLYAEPSFWIVKDECGELSVWTAAEFPKLYQPVTR